MVSLLSATTDLEKSEIILGLAILLGMLLVCFWILKLIIRTIRKIWQAIKGIKHKRMQKRWERARRKWDRNDARAKRANRREYVPPQKPAPKKTPDEIFAESPDWQWDEKTQMWRRKTTE